MESPDDSHNRSVIQENCSNPSPKPTSSPFIEVKPSCIHGGGVFALREIPAGTYILEYVGERVKGEESLRREKEQEAGERDEHGHGGVFLFELGDGWDIDGSVEWNTARLINHSCEPNCEYRIERGKIWIVALRDIKQGEELSYNYGFDIEGYWRRPCKCGSKKCVGFMVGEEFWEEVRERERQG